MGRIKKVLGSSVVLFLALASPGWTETKDSCVSCHSTLDGALGRPAKDFGSDVHHQAGLICSDCHGGNPEDDSMDAMSPAKGFRGAPAKAKVPEFCGKCHSDGSYMRRYNPKLRTDQLSQYATSVHGQRLKKGDTKVAACVDCHGVHNILAVSDSRAPVYPTNVADTCARCHSDSHSMAEYKIPTDQAAHYQKSVHATILTDGDTSAPTCTTCHGNHGATPPGLTSVANVCGTCHVFFAQLFQKSPHGAAFEEMGLPGCVQCHSNHEILKPSDEWVGVGSKSVCITCHVEGDAGYAAAQKISEDLAKLNQSQQQAENILATAERTGMEVSSARLELSQSNEAIVKARVAVHTLDPAEVGKLTDPGLKSSAKAYEAGTAALHESNLRRKGLGLSLIFIVMAIAGLALKIREMESKPRP
ncbi:MAG TPA: cytochrome c3 family protein [Terriglobia bacterium]|nr:cytochrome c3 family protein [Terriglobia bacterium]